MTAIINTRCGPFPNEIYPENICYKENLTKSVLRSEETECHQFIWTELNPKYAIIMFIFQTSILKEI